MFETIKHIFRESPTEVDPNLSDLMAQTQTQISTLEFKIDTQHADHTLRLESIETLLRRYLFLISDLE